jgi:hypothetical protein
MDSNELPGKISDLLEVFDASNVAAWLDYTSTDRFQQLGEFEDVLSELAPGDVCRVTLNSDPNNIGGGEDKWRREGFASPAKYRAHKLRVNLGHYYDSSLKSVAEEDVPVALSKAVRIAASRASLKNQGVIFIPVLLTTYKDGQRMFAATIYASSNEELPDPLRNWEYLPQDWTDVLSIEVPELSAREKNVIDELLSQPVTGILATISFVPAVDHAAAVRALESYRLLHRFVPAFQHIELQ